MTGDDVWGFGSPESLPGASSAYYDWGFGDPTPSGWSGGDPVDYGFGDEAFAVMAAFLLPVGPERLFPDDGGELAELQGTWGVATPGALGPFRVQLQDPFTGAIYPPTTEALGCYSARPGGGVACMADKTQTILRFATPNAPPGVYDVLVSYGPAFGVVLTLPKALRVIYRGRVPPAWQIRTALPELWHAAGARSSATEDLQGAE